MSPQSCNFSRQVGKENIADHNNHIISLRSFNRKDFEMTYIDPSKKQYADMSKAELDLVRLQAQEAADRFVQQHRNKPFFLRIAGTIIAAAGKSLEPQVSEPQFQD